jgi:hypothetical protein
MPRVQGVVCAALNLINHHANHNTTTESAFNPSQTNGTKLTHLPKLVVLDLSPYGFRGIFLVCIRAR